MEKDSKKKKLWASWWEKLESDNKAELKILTLVGVFILIAAIISNR